jgi:serine/alanine adding enzyme
LTEVEPEAWDALLEERGVTDVYFKRDYVEASAQLEPGRAVFLRSESAVFAAIVRADPRDVITPYGYGGPIGTDFWRHYDEWCRANEIVTTFVRFHPLYGNQRDAASNVLVEPLAGTVAWRLDAEGDLFERMHRHHRRVIRKAQEAGLEASMTVAPRTLERFVGLYELTMDRRNAASFYYFPARYWEALETSLRMHVVLFESEDAALLCLAAKPWLHYHLGATSDQGRRRGASNLLFFEAAKWAAAEGFTRFHLGGGVGGRADSLLEFKLRFDPEGLVEAATGKIVHDETAYHELVGRDAETEGFFPAYRRPASTVNA